MIYLAAPKQSEPTWWGMGVSFVKPTIKTKDPTSCHIHLFSCHGRKKRKPRWTQKVLTLDLSFSFYSEYQYYVINKNQLIGPPT